MQDAVAVIRCGYLDNSAPDVTTTQLTYAGCVFRIVRDHVGRIRCVKHTSVRRDILKEALKLIGLVLVRDDTPGPVLRAIPAEKYSAFDEELAHGSGSLPEDPVPLTGEVVARYPLFTRITPETEAALLSMGAKLLDTGASETGAEVAAYYAVPVCNLRHIEEPYRLIHIVSSPAVLYSNVLSCGEALYRGESGTFYVLCNFADNPYGYTRRVSVHPELLGNYDQNAYLFSAYAGVMVDSDKCYSMSTPSVGTSALVEAAKVLRSRRQMQGSPLAITDIPAGAALRQIDPETADQLQRLSEHADVRLGATEYFCDQDDRLLSANPYMYSPVVWRADYSDCMDINTDSSCGVVPVCLHQNNFKWFDIGDKLGSLAISPAAIARRTAEEFAPWLRKVASVGFRRIFFKDEGTEKLLAEVAQDAGLTVLHGPVDRPAEGSPNQLNWAKKYIEQCIRWNSLELYTVPGRFEETVAALLDADSTRLLLPPKKDVEKLLVRIALPMYLEIL